MIGCGKKRIMVRVTKNLGLAEDRACEPYEEIDLWDGEAESRIICMPAVKRPAANMRSGRGSNFAAPGSAVLKRRRLAPRGGRAAANKFCNKHYMNENNPDT